MAPWGAYVPRLHARWLGGDPAGDWAAVDGSLVFTDISGFTALSERLARQGKAGAEELTDIINEVMCGLLDVAVPLGGDLLKHGGDALLLLFTGGGHESRAAAAAIEMQAALRRIGSESTRRLRLTMSVGADVGPFLLCMAGRSHRELVVAGPAVTRVAALEAVADAGQVLIGSGLASALPSRCIGAAKGDGVLLRAAPPITPALAEPDDPAVDVSVGIPEALRSHLGTAVDGEHRQAAVAFVQFRGTDDLLAAEGPAALAAAIDAIMRTTQDACVTHGVTFLSTDLDKNAGKIFLVAGAPTTAGDDEDRMVSVLRAIVDGDHRLAVRAGINRGGVFTVEVGTTERRVYAVMGDTVNLAARVMGAAPSGTCLATIPVVERLATDYQTEPIEPFMAKGKAKPVSAVLVGPALGARHGGTLATGMPFVGREAERKILLRAVDDARAGRTRVIELIGEAGIGKSRLIAELCADASDLTTIVIEGSQYASTTPYRAVRDAMRGLLGLGVYEGEDVVVKRLTDVVRERARHLEPWIPLLALPFGATVPETPQTAALVPAFRRTRLNEVTSSLCTALMPEHGVLVVEDAYWLDEGSAELLLHLVAALQHGLQWVVCIARRSVPTALDLSRLSEVTHLEVCPLPVEDALSLARSAGGELAAAEVQTLVERSGGNPLFLQELAAAAARGTAVDELPDTVEALIAAHVDTLGPADRSLLRVASVLGVRLPSDLLAKLADDPRASSRATIRRLGGLLVPDGDDRLRFRHALIREVAYEGLPYKRRRALHGRAAELVQEFAGDDGDGASESLSLHYFAAGRHFDAWHWSRVAAERARRQAAPVESAAFLQRALEAARHAGIEPIAVAETNEALGDVCELGGRYEQAAAAYRQARKLRSGDPISVTNLVRKEGWVKERAGRYREALRWYTRGFRLLEQVEPGEDAGRLTAELYLAYGAVRIRQGRHRDAVPLLEAAVRHAEPLDALSTLAHAYTDLDWAWSELGTPEPRYRQLALPIYEALDDWGGQGSTLNNLGLGAYYEGRWDEALDFWSRAGGAFAQAGDVVQQATAVNNIGEILSDQGHLDEAEREFTAALCTWRETRFPVGIGLATSNLGRVATRRGRFDDARDLLASAAEQLRAIGAGELASEAEAREAERLLLIEDDAGALELAEAVRSQANRPTLIAQVERTIGYAHAQRADLDTARTWLHQSLATAERVGAAYEVALTREAIMRVERLSGRSVPLDPLVGEILDRLSVVWTAKSPLPGVAAVVLGA